jgi:hypothetical protein
VNTGGYFLLLSITALDFEQFIDNFPSFDSLVEPILLYGSEVWGFENTCSLEKNHLQFCKKILQVRATTPSYMIYGELGCYPLSIKKKLRMIYSLAISYI